MKNIKKDLKETRSNLKMTWKFIRKRKKKLIIMTFISLIISILGVILPVLSAKLLLNLSSGLFMDLIKVSIFMFIIEITRNLFSLILSRIFTYYTTDTLTEIQLEMFSETLKIESGEIDKNTSGTFIDRINNDTNDIIRIFDNLIQSFLDFISNIGVLIAIFVISKAMFVYFIITTIILGIINRKRRNIYQEKSKKFRKIREKRTGLVSEIVRGMKDVKLLNAEDGILKKANNQLLKVNKESLEMDRTARVFNFITGNLRDLFDVLFFIIGVYLVTNQNLPIASFVILYTYKGRTEMLLSYYNFIADLIKNYNLSATRVFEVLEGGFKKEDTTGNDIDKIEGYIEFKNVSFSYDEDLVLDNVSFDIKPGERIGFVGASGSGKSTIFSLLTKLYTLKDGNILIDRKPINNISTKSLRKHISLIPQNPYIFNFSIKDNLIISNPKATDDEIVEACKKSEIYERILEFDEKFNTEVGEGGVTLSGGEKQRLAIARSLLKKSNIILFDEATSALDNITQDKVQKAIYGLDKNKTILIIAHRLSTVINCDKIIVVDNGRILDVGPHEELLRRCEKYKELFKYEDIK